MAVWWMSSGPWRLRLGRDAAACGEQAIVEEVLGEMGKVKARCGYWAREEPVREEEALARLWQEVGVLTAKAEAGAAPGTAAI